ncbi:MAG: HAMP domain-containing histidine kinase [Chloroflexi bacterium]|nr:HAMP domain-containing histidine kinase [Chloroflexota bacterium]
MRRAFRGLHARLLLAHLLVIAVGLTTLYLAATVAAPRIFERNMIANARRGPALGPNAGAGSGSGAGGQLARPQQPPGMGPLGVMSAELERRVTESYLASIADSLLVAGSAALATAVVVSVFVSRGIARPIHRLAGASHRLADGHYDERVPVEGATETRQLAASFNAMATAVEDAERRRQELIGDVAHEMRTPIATLEGYLEGLLDGVIAPSDRVWAKLHDEAGRLRRLVEDLHELSRAEAHQLPVVVRPTAPAEIVRPAVERVEGDAAALGLTVTVETPPSLPLVSADRERAIQVLTNLLTNALRYTPPPRQIVVRVAAEPDAVRFTVTDSGIGIAPEHLPRVFERFYRVDKSRSRAMGGAGVGLTIARALVEMMGGRMMAESEGEGQGATFAFVLPLSDGPPASGSHQAGPAPDEAAPTSGQDTPEPRPTKPLAPVS